LRVNQEFPEGLEINHCKPRAESVVRRGCASVVLSRRRQRVGLVHYAHVAASVILIVALVPLFRRAGLPLHFAWRTYFVTYWWALAVQSVVLALVLYAVQFPAEFKRSLLGPSGPPADPRKPIAAVLIPTVYLFVMFIIVFSYNDLIAYFRFDGSADVFLERIDSWILGGRTVRLLAGRFSPGLLESLEPIYFGMFPQLGACLIFLALRRGLGESMRFIAAIATSYYLGLAAFFFVPATGPYYLSASAGATGYLGRGQLEFVRMLGVLKSHHPLPVIGTDYYVALPCLHLTQPLIALCFLWRWKRIAAMFVAYDLVLVAAILLLQQHYVVDLLAAIAAALMAIAASGGPNAAPVASGKTVNIGSANEEEGISGAN
jgi:PAP2 superfamily